MRAACSRRALLGRILLTVETGLVASKNLRVEEWQQILEAEISWSRARPRSGMQAAGCGDQRERSHDARVLEEIARACSKGSATPHNKMALPSN